MRIEVTQSDIEIANAARQVPGYDICAICPISVALRRIIPEFPWYTGILAVARDPEQMYAENIIPLPEEATDFINHWDCDLPVQPFEFELEI